MNYPLPQSMSPGLKRAREPYRIKNAITGLTLGAFAVAIWAYSINAVKQDVFDDVDEEARAMSATRTPETKSDLAVSPEATRKAVSPASTANSVALKEVARAETQSTSKRGVLHYLDKQFPWLLDLETKTLVRGAPSIDNPGKMWKS